MVDGTRPEAGDLGSAVQACVVALGSGWVSATQSKRVERLLDRFVLFTAAQAVTSCEGVGRSLARAFVTAVDGDGVVPSVASMHFRRTALRLLFRAAREAGLASGDPTLDLVLPPRSPLSSRPLTDDEVALCRSVAVWSLSDSRRAAAWALTEAGCRTSELPAILPVDIDLDEGRVWVHGGRTTRPRWAPLDEWGIAQLRRRMTELADVEGRPLVYGGRGRGDAAQVSSCVAINDVLERAGLAAEPDVRPASVAAWAGRRILRESGRIEVVARRLGMSSLDRTARFIAWDWHDEDSTDG